MAGRKAASLALLLNEGFPVPAGLVVTSQAFLDALAPYRPAMQSIIGQANLQEASACHDAAAAIDKILQPWSIPDRLRARLREAQPALGDGWLAVRSSATIEDQANASLAGQYRTSLGVSGRDQVEAAILDCWRSFYSGSALSAMAGTQSGDSEIAMAVLIQPLVQAECAGVCFSMDPTLRHPNCLLINAAWGLGQGVVDGSVPSDAIWVRRSDLGIQEERIAVKESAIKINPDGGTILSPVPAELQRQACLPPAWLERIAQFGLAAEQALGAPQDVEWAIADGQVWILQSRPIASLAVDQPAIGSFPVEWKNPEDHRRLWSLETRPSFGNRPLRPLDLDYWALRESIRLETCLFLGADRNMDMLVFNGRTYFSPAVLPISPADRQVRRDAYQDLAERLAREKRTAWDYWGPEIEQAVERLAKFDFSTMDGSSLASHLEQAMAVTRRLAMLHPMIWFKPRQGYFEAFQRLIDRSGAEAEASAYRLLDMDENPFSQILDELYRLAQVARGAPAVAVIVENPPVDCLARLAALPEASTFNTLLARFIDTFGDRNGDGYGSEASVTTPTWREQPDRILRMAARYLDPNVESPAAIRKRVRKEHDDQVAALAAASPDPGPAAIFMEQLMYTRKVGAVLEIHNHIIDQLSMGRLRRAVLTAACWMASKAILEDAEDAAWLDFNEILQALRSPQPGSLTGLIAERRTAYLEWSRMEAPAILGLPGANLAERPPQRGATFQASLSEGPVVSGTGASPGQGQGRARLVKDLATLMQVQAGEILVAGNAGPQWTLYFPGLGGIVLDSGSPGQHAASIAREYGIPAVVDCKNATRIIPEGAWVQVNGDQGVVEWQPAPDRALR